MIQVKRTNLVRVVRLSQDCNCSQLSKVAMYLERFKQLCSIQLRGEPNFIDVEFPVDFETKNLLGDSR